MRCDHPGVIPVGMMAYRRGVAGTRSPAAAGIALLAGLVLLLAGCGSSRNPEGSLMAASDGLEARLTGKNSPSIGIFRVFDRFDGVAVEFSIVNTIPGTYRLTLHEGGNCRSPNLFSAGPAWAPPGSGRAPDELLPSFTTNSDGDMVSYTAFFSGARTAGPQSLLGRIVVLQFGRGAADALPGVPNNRMGCGVLEPIKTLF